MIFLRVFYNIHYYKPFFAFHKWNIDFLINVFMHEIILYGSYLVFPLLFLCFYSKKIPTLLRIIVIFLCILFVWVRFIEPQNISVKTTKIDLWFSTNIALISDLHIGTYKNEKFVQKIVDKVNTLDVDVVLIAWDLTYYPKIEDLWKLFAPLWDINKPVYWVLWNHDVEKPGPALRKELISVLTDLWLHYLNNEAVSFENYDLLWLGSNWNDEDEVGLLGKYSESDNVIVLTHNPDTTLSFTNKNADLTLVGHTHGGQIRIPFLYKKVIPTHWDFDKGLTQEENTLLFTTSGIWETGLPMRFLNFPVIDVLKIQ